MTALAYPRVEVEGTPAFVSSWPLPLTAGEWERQGPPNPCRGSGRTLTSASTPSPTDDGRRAAGPGGVKDLGDDQITGTTHFSIFVVILGSSPTCRRKRRVSGGPLLLPTPPTALPAQGLQGQTRDGSGWIHMTAMTATEVERPS